MKPAAPVFLLLLLLCPLRVAADTSWAGGEGTFDVRSAAIPPHGSWAIALGGVYYSLNDRHDPLGEGRNVGDGGLLVSTAFRGRIELFGRIGVAAYQNDGKTPISPRDGRIGTKIALPWKTGWLSSAGLVHLNMPWGNRDRGFSTGSFDPSIGGAVTFELPESNALSFARAHVNVGYQWHGDARGRVYEGWPTFYLEPPHAAERRNRVDLRGALEFGTPGVRLFAELLLDQLVSDDISFWESPVFLNLGFRHDLTKSVSLSLASKIAISSDDPSTTKFRPPEDMFPEWQLGFLLSYTIGRELELRSPRPVEPPEPTGPPAPTDVSPEASTGERSRSSAR